MFLRKLLVMILPLILCAALCMGMPLIVGLGFFTQVLRGVVLGGALSLILPLCGASRRRETFGKLLWVVSVPDQRGHAAHPGADLPGHQPAQHRAH